MRSREEMDDTAKWNNSPVDDALDRLRGLLPLTAGCGCDNCRRNHEALATVREALERQRENEGDAEYAVRQMQLWRETAEGAEAEVARLKAVLRDEEMEARHAERAEAEVRRLTEGLREVRQLCAEGHGDDLIAERADALLSANPQQGDAAAGSIPPDGGGA